jgi:DNA-binding CsgD family transcriptional regulator
MLAQAQARFDEAFRLGNEALATMAPVGYAPAFMLWSGLVSNLCHHTGITAELVAAAGITGADAAQQDWPLVGIVQTLAPAWILARIGRQREALAIYRRLGPASHWRAMPHGALFTWAMGIKVGIALGADEDVATHRSVLGAHRGHHIVNGKYAMAYFGPAELWLGVAAAHLGLLDDAVADLEEAVKACAANGADGFRAEAQYELATVLVRRAGAGDRQHARTLLREVTPHLAALGMAPLRAQAEALRAQLDTEASTVLTHREREVAELVAAGLTNREVASRLFLSERTAQNHVQHILDKLHLPNRSQIAVWVSQMSRSTE